MNDRRWWSRLLMAAAVCASLALGATYGGQLLDGTCTVRLRQACGALRWGFDYQDSDRTATVSANDRRLKLQVGSRQAELNGQPLELGVAPYIEDDALWAPARPLAESLGASVTADVRGRRLVLRGPGGAFETRLDRPEPRIQITDTPPAGAGSHTWGDIEGVVSGVDPSRYAVVLYAKGGGTWYVQPWANDHRTAIADDRTFHSGTHLGSRYAALLVRRSAETSLPATCAALPTRAAGVVAYHIAEPNE